MISSRRPDPLPDRGIDTHDLWADVQRLTRSRREKLRRDVPGTRKTTTEWITVDSLLEQLQGRLGSTTTSDGSPSKSTGSPSPLDVHAASLLHDMSRAVIAELRHRGATPRPARQPAVTYTALPAPVLGRLPAADDGLGVPVLEPDVAGRLAERAAGRRAAQRDRADTARIVHDLASDLAQLAALIADSGDQDYVDDWARQYRSWVAQVETALTVDPEESITVRGIRYGERRFCPACGADKVTREQDGETFRDPALVATFRDHQLVHVTCRVCAAGWWRGEGLDELGQLISPPVASSERMRA